MNAQTRKRKGEHIEICVKKDVGYTYNWFDDIEFVHEALTDLDYDRLDTRARFLKHQLKLPFMITGMTGGYPEAKQINMALASACEEYGIAFGLGSQRAMIENPALAETYSVREVAPTIPIVGNIGAAQLLNYKPAQISKMLDDVQADYVAVHLNTLQELTQPEGDRKFSGVAGKINELAKELYERFGITLKHFDELGTALKKATENYNKTVGSLESRILPSLRRFKELGVSVTGELPVAEEITVFPRTKTE